MTRLLRLGRLLPCFLPFIVGGSCSQAATGEVGLKAQAGDHVMAEHASRADSVVVGVSLIRRWYQFRHPYSRTYAHLGNTGPSSELIGKSADSLLAALVQTSRYIYVSDIPKAIPKNQKDPIDIRTEVRAELAQRFGSSDASKFRFLQTGFDSLWTRDHIGLPLHSGAMAVFRWRPGKDQISSDAAPWGRKLAEALGKEMVFVPTLHDGGNFMISGDGTCFFTDAVIEDNRRGASPAKTESRIRALYREKLGCKQLHLIAALPGEETKHIDQFAKFLDDQTMIVAAINEEAIAPLNTFVDSFRDANNPEQLSEAGRGRLERFVYALSAKNERWLEKTWRALKSSANLAREQARFLNGFAKQLENGSFGGKRYVVKRVPISLPAPALRWRDKSVESDETLDSARPYPRTYANTLFLNGHAIVPKFEEDLGYVENELIVGEHFMAWRDLRQSTLLPHMNEAAQSTFAPTHKVLASLADGPALKQGAVHCITMEIEGACPAHRPRWDDDAGRCSN